MFFVVYDRDEKFPVRGVYQAPDGMNSTEGEQLVSQAAQLPSDDERDDALAKHGFRLVDWCEVETRAASRCDECGEPMPDDAESYVSKHHSESCSLNPKNVTE